jgi:peptidyl-prolyl cis-trans isomerase A (cyclophilin A)
MPLKSFFDSEPSRGYFFTSLFDHAGGSLTVAASNMQQADQSLEALENRTFLSATPLAVKPSKVASAYFDNRGQVFMLFTVGLDKATLSRKTAALYIAGTDGLFGTPDDVRLNTKVGYTRGRLSLRSSALALNQAYRVRLNAAVIQDANGRFLDGEFNGNNVLSGNGHAGGNYDVVANTAAKTTARFTTIAGFMNVRLYPNHAPITVANFEHYANEGAWDNSIFHRSIADFVIQGGGKVINASNQVDDVHNHGTIQNEPDLSDQRGTIAMARAVDNNPATTADQNSATTQWYFNLKANTDLDTADGGFTVFGELLNDGSLEVMDAIAAFKTINANPQTDPNGVYSDLPIRDLATVQANGIDPSRDLIVVNRIAMLFDPTATPNVQSPAAVKPAVVTAAAMPVLSPPISTAFSGKKVDDQNSLFE